MEGSEETHGAPLGAEEVRETKKLLGCEEDAEFCVPDRVYEIFAERKRAVKKHYDEWMDLFTTHHGAEKLKRFPPLTTLATRLMCTTRSMSSDLGVS